MRFWCQLGSIFTPKIDENPSKNRSQDGSILWSIWGWIFYRFGLDFESQLGSMLASKIDQKLPQTLPRRIQDELRTYFFDLSASSPRLGTTLARFWEVLSFILEGFGCPRAAKIAKMMINWPPNLAPFWNPFLKPSWGPNKLARRYLGVSLSN